MKQINSALILYPNQLFAPELLPPADVIYLVEEPLFFGLDDKRPLKMHKQKLMMHRASMRRYVEEELWQRDLNVEYIELDTIEFSADVLVRAQASGAEVVMIFDPTDHLLESRLKKALDDTVETPFELRILPSPGFMLKRGEVRDYFAAKTMHNFSDFYQWQRERFNILIGSDYKPVGEKWMLEAKRQMLSEGQVSPGFVAFGDNDYLKEAKKWVEAKFPDNPGDDSSFFWPTSRAEAMTWLDDFIKHRLNSFAAYSTEIDNQAVLLYHSGLSPILNTGLLTPKQILDNLARYNRKQQLDLISLENFIRRIIGWREYVRGLYVTQTIEVEQPPHQNTSRGLSQAWWDGTTGLPPVDDAIHQVLNHAYLSDVERLMVVVNVMTLCEVKIDEIYHWFASLLIDAYDWALVPNIYGLAQLNNLGGIISKPFITGADYILEVSHYKKDIWCDIWDGLFWDFVEKHKTVLKTTPYLKSTVDRLDKITPEHRRIISYRAKDFLDSIS